MKTHRGLSAVVGTVFLIAVVIGALSYISYSVDIMGNFSEQLIAEETRQKNIQDEKFDLLTVDIVGNKLDATIKNTGEIPVKITTLYLDEMGTNTDTVQKININKSIAPGNSFNFLSEGIDVDVISTKGYSMKLVSSRGETQTFYLNSASQEALDIQLIALPDRIPTGFTTTIMMIVVNNMSNNNPLVNLTPIEPDCSGICTDIGLGPTPASYDMLEPGDVAIFEWVYELDGNDGQSVEFTSGLQNGFPGNTDSKTVTITSVQVSELAGQSIESAGFGQSELADDVMVLHLETYGIPSPEGDYQMHSGVPDNAGQTLPFTTDDSYQWFSSNATSDTTIDAGDWTVSLRYNHAALPSELDIADIGMKLHFEETDTSTDLYDSGNNSDCYSLAESAGADVSGATWYADRGVNGSGAYYFDGNNDRLSIPIDGQDDGCTNAHHLDYSVSGWFKADRDDSHYAQQWIYSMINYDNGDGGGFAIYLGDGNSNNNNHGKLYFLARGDESGDVALCEGDEPDGDGGVNYMDGQWHHFVGTAGDASGECNLYIDGVWKDSDSDDVGHWDIKNDLSEDYHIGADSGNNNEFSGYIDDVMFWYQKEMDQAEVTGLKEFSFGNNATNFNFYLNNATGVGDTLDVLISETNVGMPWGDPYRRVNTGDEWIGNDYVVTLPQVGMKNVDPFGRLNFTMERVSGEPLNLRIDDAGLIGSVISSHIHTPPVEPELPVFHTHDRDNQVTFFAFNTADSEGVWFTYQGTRIIFNGTGGHYTGIVDTVSNGVDMSSLSADTDSPFVDENVEADIVFWHPQSTPTALAATGDDRIPEGEYDVSIYLNGYDEDGTVFIRTIALGSVLVVE